MSWSTDDIISKMFGMTKIATVDFNSNKNCFIVLPNSWAQEFRRKEVSVFELQWGDSGKGYLSWSGEIGRSSLGASNNDASIQINGLLGNKLGLRHGQEVLMKQVTSVWSCYKLTVEPASVDDWEILELNSSYIETRLLDQVRIVWTGQVIPVWIDKMCIFIKIASTEPEAPCVRLEQNTEMIITPKNRLPQSNPPTPSKQDIHPGHGLLQTKNRSDSGSGSSSSEISGNSSVSGYISDFDSMSSLSSGFEHNVWSYDTSHVSKSEGGTNNPSMPWEVDPVDIEGAIPWSYKIWRKLISFVSREADINRVRRDCANEEDARRKMAAEFWKDVRIVARVQPMFNHKKNLKTSRRQREGSTSASSETSEDSKKDCSSLERSHRKTSNRFTRQMSLNSHVVKPREPFSVGSSNNPTLPGETDSLSNLMQPTTVYLSSVGDSEFLWQYAANTEEGGSAPPSEYVTFLATMTKQPSPKERNEELKQKLLQESKKEQNNLASSNNTRNPSEVNEEPEISAGESEEKRDGKSSCIVRIIVHCHELKSHCKKDSVNPYSSTVFQDKPTQWYIQIPDILRRQMGLELSAGVQLKPVVSPPSPIQSMILAPLFDLKESMNETMILRAFNQWLTCVSCMISPIPIVQTGNLLSFPITPDFTGEFLLSVNHDVKESSKESYYLLHPFVTRNAETALGPKPKIEKAAEGTGRQLPVRTIKELDEITKGFRLRELGPMANLGREALEHLTATLTSRPLGRQLCASVPGQRHGGVLICGGRGSGKTTVAKAVCQEASEWPLLAFVKVVECHSLKGKGVDTIRKIWEEAFDEAAWRQPSVILLDDLDHVTAAPLGPEQEMGPEATYNSRLAQVLKDLVTNEINEGSRIALLATCSSKKSIHQSLLSSRGLHLFQSCLEISPLSKADRATLLTSVIHSKVEIDLQTLTQVDPNILSSKMDGFVASDLVTVTERAVHAGSSREISLGHHASRIKGADGDHPSNEILLCQEDFETALHSYSPAALRDVPLHSAGELGWEDVGGLKGVKQDLVETLQLPAKYPELFASCPLRLRSGLLLYGPPGTGKTLLGGVVAKECGLNFISIKGPELLSKYIGASEQAVRDLFTRAMSAKPCVLFFDEFDSLAPRRGHDSTGVTDRVVNQLLTQLDGVEGLEGVYVIGATSRPDLIDPALLRPGRLDKCLFCPIPTAEERVEILQALARKMTLRSNVDLAAIASKLDHFTGADLKALLYNAQLEAIHSTLMQSDRRDSNLGLPLTSSLHNCSMEADEWKLTFLETFSESDHGPYQEEASNINHRLASLSEAERALAATMKLTGDIDEMDGEDDVEGDGFRGRRKDLRLDLRGGLTSSDLNGNMAGAGAMSKTLLTELMREDSESTEQDENPSPPEGSGFDAPMTEVPPTPSLPPDTPIAPPQSQQQRVVYMPTLRDGVVDPTPETREIIGNEVDVIVENYARKLAGESMVGTSDNTMTEDVSVIRVSQNHLLRAAQGMKPSVSVAERQKYKQIYESFVKSRGGEFPQGQAAEATQKVTLA
ncbi:peroxisome biogenesis factor 1-like [Lytechinus variegatus]|uniref:peroxisome biogenesis factor 1-like n=1 Tax=Lytechinus variegatus TaxID=7654 RepID=UPI001BB188D5|nr:peroxisome biogenesis factor 1-like [Lytechinus variegatus]